MSTHPVGMDMIGRVGVRCPEVSGNTNGPIKCYMVKGCKLSNHPFNIVPLDISVELHSGLRLQYVGR